MTALSVHTSVISSLHRCEIFQLPSSAQERFEAPLAALTRSAGGRVSQLGAPKGSSYLGMGMWLRQALQEQGLHGEQLRAVLLHQLQGHSSALLPFLGTACCARGQSACSSHCHLPQSPAWHKPGASSSLSLSYKLA